MKNPFDNTDDSTKSWRKHRGRRHRSSLFRRWRHRHHAPPPEETQEDAVPLSRLTSGQSGTVVSIAGGEGFRHKVIAMGILPGAVVRLQSYGRSGPLVVIVNGTRLGLGRQLADRIYVDPDDVHLSHG